MSSPIGNIRSFPNREMRNSPDGEMRKFAIGTMRNLTNEKFTIFPDPKYFVQLPVAPVESFSRSAPIQIALLTATYFATWLNQTLSQTPFEVLHQLLAAGWSSVGARRPLHSPETQRQLGELSIYRT